jgi:hypothetical protein
VTTTPELDTTGREFLLITLGGCPDGRNTVIDWATQAIAAGRSVTVHVQDQLDLSQIEQAVTDSRTGTRIAVAGPEYDVMQALAAIQACGALPCEVRSYVTSAGTISLFCPHCAHTHRVETRPGSAHECPSCRLLLDIRVHRNSHRGSYLGSVAA